MSRRIATPPLFGLSLAVLTVAVLATFGLTPAAVTLSGGPYMVCVLDARMPTEDALGGEAPEGGAKYLSTSSVGPFAGQVLCEYTKNGQVIWLDRHQVVPAPVLIVWAAIAGAALCGAVVTWPRRSASM